MSFLIKEIRTEIRYKIDKEKFLKFLKKHKLTQKDVAKNVGLSQQYLNDLMNGRRFPLCQIRGLKVLNYEKKFMKHSAQVGEK